jgi:ethanolamine ammonia-lyase small subunit
MAMKKLPATSLITADPWPQLRQLTAARIALGVAGTSLPTAAHLAFQGAHALARDAVHRQLEVEPIRQALAKMGLSPLLLHSAAADRPIYLRRPDQGRRLDRASRQRLEAARSEGCDLALVIADGLSAQAIQANAVALVDALRPRLAGEGWRLAPPVLVEQGRVAIGDEIGEVLRVPLVAVLIGERPGLGSPDSMGIYLSYGPRVGLSDAQRNCISNIRRDGLSVELAAAKLHYLMREARRRQLTGVMLKDEAEMSALPAATGNFLAAAK